MSADSRSDYKIPHVTLLLSTQFKIEGINAEHLNLLSHTHKKLYMSYSQVLITCK